MTKQTFTIIILCEAWIACNSPNSPVESKNNIIPPSDSSPTVSIIPNKTKLAPGDTLKISLQASDSTLANGSIDFSDGTIIQFNHLSKIFDTTIVHIYYQVGIYNIYVKFSDGNMTTSSSLIITVTFVWTTQSSGTINTLYSVFFTKMNTGVVVGDNGTILRTINEGTTWETVSSGTAATLNRVSFVNELIGTVVGTGGTILRTIDGGKSWTPQISGTNSNLHSVSFIDANDGAVVGDNGTILLTKDGGTNWINQTPIKWDTIIPPSPPMLYDVCYPEPNHIIALSGGTWSFSLRTTNGGTNWVYERNVPSNYPRIIFWNKDTGMMFCPDHMTGQNWTIVYKTTDGGNTWFQYGGSTGGIYAYDVSFSNPDNGMIVGSPSSVGGSTIECTTDGGQTWTAQSSGTTSIALFGVFFIAANNGTIVGSGGTILHTTPGGM